jgi:hypothetical protein
VTVRFNRVDFLRSAVQQLGVGNGAIVVDALGVRPIVAKGRPALSSRLLSECRSG